MYLSYNKCIFIGVVSEDPILMRTKKGDAYAYLYLNVIDGVKPNKECRVKFLAMDIVAVHVVNYLKKNRIVFIDGKLSMQTVKNRYGECIDKYIIKIDSFRGLGYSTSGKNLNFENINNENIVSEYYNSESEDDNKDKKNFYEVTNAQLPEEWLGSSDEEDKKGENKEDKEENKEEEKKKEKPDQLSWAGGSEDWENRYIIF